MAGNSGHADADEDSDLDVLMVGREIQDHSQEYQQLRRTPDWLHVGVDLFLITEDDLQKKRDCWSAAAYRSVRKGKVLYERA